MAIEKNKDGSVKFNVQSFVKGSKEEKELVIPEIVDVTPVNMVKITDTKPKKVTKKETTVNPVDPNSSMTYIQSNIPYNAAFQDTNKQLDEAITQLNIIGGELMQEIQQVRMSKTLRNKYNYLNDMTQTAASIINFKIGAIKEKNDVIHSAHKLELQRMKELKSTMNEEDDSQKLASMYYAFVNTPVGVGPVNMGPAPQELTMPAANYNTISLGSDTAASWQQNLNPAENRMLLDAKGMIETVVVFNEATGDRYFDVIDKQTGQSLPNVERPDSSYIYELDINPRTGVAKDMNRNTLYRLITIGGNQKMMEY